LERKLFERSPRTPADWRLGAALILAAACLGCSGRRCSGRRYSGRRDASIASDLRFGVDPGATGSGSVDAPARTLLQEDPDAHYRAGFFAANGLYLSCRTHWSLLGGDFDGDTTLVGPDTIFVPDADDGIGYELALGWMTRGWAMEVSYSRITYDGSIGAASADIEYQAISLNGLHYLRANEALEPYFLVGLVFPWADLDDASSFGGPLGDAELTNGFGLDAGLGLSWWFGPHLALDLRSLFTYQTFEEAEGVSGDSGSIDDGVEGPSFSLSLGLTWAFGKADKEGGP
jgi:hypothetical protein